MEAMERRVFVVKNLFNVVVPMAETADAEEA
jgi:hypothetical protein